MMPEKMTFAALTEYIADGGVAKLIDAGHNGEEYALTFELEDGRRVDVSPVDIYETFNV